MLVYYEYKVTSKILFLSRHFIFGGLSRLGPSYFQVNMVPMLSSWLLLFLCLLLLSYFVKGIFLLMSPFTLC